MNYKLKKRIYAVVGLIVVAVLALWVSSRWDAWFHNPAEEPYVVSKTPTRVLLTFGNDGELSRYVSWMCDTAVTDDAHLLLAKDGDTLKIAAKGEVFVSRAGKACYYRAYIKQLEAECEYSYAVVTGGHTSSWYSFRTFNPESESFAFLFMGDVQDSIGGIANTLLRGAISRHPEVEFVAFGGDLTERPTDAYWGETFRSIDSICTAMPVLTVTGNHDYLKYLIRKCERRFSLVFPYYLKGMDERGDENHLFRMQYHNTDLFLLDSDREFFYLWSQRNWLAEELDRQRAPHGIVMVHHPLYSVKKKNNNLIQRWMLNDLIQDAKIDLVLQGHEHAYARCTSDDKPLKGNVCNNAPLYTVSHCSPKNYKIKPSERFHPVVRDTRTYQIVKVNGRTMTMLAYNAMTHELIDSVIIK